LLLRTESWFQFNDETVTKIKTLGDQGIIDVDFVEEKYSIRYAAA
jgi:hypothetical protein